MKSISHEVYNLIDAIINDSDFERFTYSKLQEMSSLSISELRSMVNILIEYNILYSKRKIGLFRNDEYIRKYITNKFEESQDCQKLIIKSKHLNIEFNMLEFDLLDDVPSGDWTAEKILTVLVLFHRQINFFYRKRIAPCESNEKLIMIKREALRCNDNQLIFTSTICFDDIEIYK